MLSVSISCVNSKHSLTDDSIDELIKHSNFSRTLFNMIVDNDFNLHTYDIFELGFSISILDNTILIMRNGCYQKGISVDMIEPLIFLQNSMYEKNEYLIGLNRYFSLRIMIIPYSDDFLENDLTNIDKIK
jgi:hypothetical protein